MNSHEVLSNGNLKDTMISVVETLENLKAQRDKISQDIEESYELREKNNNYKFISW